MEFLEHQPDVAATPAVAPALAERGNLHLVPGDAARVRAPDPGQQVEQAGLARSGWARDPDHRAARRRERCAVKHRIALAGPVPEYEP
jgi:hypothetical protein